MKKSFNLVIAGSIVSATLMLCAAPAMAHGPRVDWAITVGLPYYAPPVYYNPPPVYYRPPPRVVYVQPEPVYREREVLRYRGPYYGYQQRQWQERQGQDHHGQRGHHDDDDDD